MALFFIANPIMARLADPFIPKIFYVYINRELNRWMRQGLLKKYNLNIKRISTLYYAISVKLFIDRKQTNILLLNYVLKKLSAFPLFETKNLE